MAINIFISIPAVGPDQEKFTESVPGGRAVVLVGITLVIIHPEIITQGLTSSTIPLRIHIVLSHAPVIPANQESARRRYAQTRGPLNTVICCYLDITTQTATLGIEPLRKNIPVPATPIHPCHYETTGVIAAHFRFILVSIPYWVVVHSEVRVHRRTIRIEELCEYITGNPEPAVIPGD